MVISTVQLTYLETIERLRAAPSARARAAIIDELARTLQVARQTVYAGLKRAGWDTGRAARKDKGTSAVTEEQLVVIAELVASSVNKRGRQNLPQKRALKLANDNNLVDLKISTGHLSRKLQQYGLSRKHMLAPAPGISRVSRHPNQVWFFDISIAIQWYFRDEAGKKLDLYHEGGRRFYEGKGLDPAKRVVHRFCATDHCTGAYYVQYYYSAGESAADVIDFLYRAMAAKEWAGAAMPFRGVPTFLVFDQGSANKSALVQNLCKSLNIEAQYHKTGNAKASGSVETRHRHWQESFEAEQAIARVKAKDVVELNIWAEKKCAVLLSENKLTRTGRAPMHAWLDITQEQLVEAPARDVFLAMAKSNEKTGTLTSTLHLRASGRTWYISGEHVHPGQKVLYRITPFAEAGVRVTDLEGKVLAALEISKDKYGFPEQGPRHVWGDADAKGASISPTPAQKITAEITEGTRAPRIERPFEHLDAELARYNYLHRTGTPHAASAEPEEELLDHYAAREWVRRQLGRDLSVEEGTWWRQQVGHGVTMTQLRALLTESTTALPATAQAAK